MREFRASADARVPFPQGKGTKGCRGPARFPCGAPAPGPPSDKKLVSVEPRRGAPSGVPSGSALTAPLKTFRFQRGPVLRGGKSQRVRDALCAWHSFGGAGAKKPPLKGEVPAKRAEGFRLPRRKVAAALSAAVTTTPKTRKRAHVSWAHKPEEKRKPIPSRSSGEGGLGERRFSQRSGLSPSVPHTTVPTTSSPRHAS